MLISELHVYCGSGDFVLIPSKRPRRGWMSFLSHDQWYLNEAVRPMNPNDLFRPVNLKELFDQ